MDSKGIATVDLLFATLLAVIIIGSMVSLVNTEINQSTSGDFGNARLVGEKVAQAINTVYTNGNGYSLNLTLPSNINYSIFVNNTGFLTVSFNTQSTKIKLIPQTNITSITMTAGNSYRIWNKNGTISITAI
jgi:hypothetical protein